LAKQTLGVNYGMSREHAIDLAFVYDDGCSLGVRGYANDFCNRRLTGQLCFRAQKLSKPRIFRLQIQDSLLAFL
jgi:hypothetical protein